MGGYLEAREFMKNLLEKSIETSIFENLHYVWENFKLQFEFY